MSDKMMNDVAKQIRKMMEDNKVQAVSIPTEDEVHALVVEFEVLRGEANDGLDMDRLQAKHDRITQIIKSITAYKDFNFATRH